MKKPRILFVTKDDEHKEDGLSYALYLAQTMNKAVSILLLSEKRFVSGFDNAFAAVAFAEANEHETARAMMASQGPGGPRGGSEDRFSRFQKECEDAGVDVQIHATHLKGIPAVRDFLKDKSNIELVLMSPSINQDRSVTRRALKTLVDIVARPITVIGKRRATA